MTEKPVVRRLRRFTQIKIMRGGTELDNLIHSNNQNLRESA